MTEQRISWLLANTSGKFDEVLTEHMNIIWLYRISDSERIGRMEDNFFSVTFLYFLPSLTTVISTWYRTLLGFLAGLTGATVNKANHRHNENLLDCFCCRQSLPAHHLNCRTNANILRSQVLQITGTFFFFFLMCDYDTSKSKTWACYLFR